MVAKVSVVLEEGRAKVFARALDWPGWCRWAKTPELAIDALLDYAPRYLDVAERAGLKFAVEPEIVVVERLPGNATTEFGAPSAISSADSETLRGKELERQIALLSASWDAFDAITATSTEALRKGPRGGGRDRTKVIEHVLEAERGYVPKLGVRTKKSGADDAVTIAANRALVCDALRSGVVDPKWPLRYWIDRTAWHVLDHAWEIEDKQT